MVAWTATSPRYYFRRDPDVGWTAAFHRFRVAFQVVRRPGAKDKQ